MLFQNQVEYLIQRRYSCRSYLSTPISPESQVKIEKFFDSVGAGPFGGQARFKLVSASASEREELKGLGTYGTIRNAMGFIIGAVRPEEKNLEDFGYLMEKVVLFADDQDLGTVWIGGFFTRSTFSKKIKIQPGEVIPVVVAAGYADEASKARDFFRKQAGSDHRYPWSHLFFDGDFMTALERERCGEAALALEMVRLAPSASNQQPWRIVRDHKKDAWHFYLRRTPGYAAHTLGRLIGIPDLQRVDMGISMCHFELACREKGLSGEWMLDDPGIQLPDRTYEYSATWIDK